MKILLDHNLPRKLRRDFFSHEVNVTKELGWAGLSNGFLLSVAQNVFDVLLTVDANIYHQQNVALYDIAVVVLRVYDNSYEAILPLLPQVMPLLEQVEAGEIRYVYVDEVLRLSDQQRGKWSFAHHIQ